MAVETPSMEEQRAMARAPKPSGSGFAAAAKDAQGITAANEQPADATLLQAPITQGSSTLLPLNGGHIGDPGDIQLPSGASPKAADSFRAVKEQRDQFKTELENAKRELEQAKATGTKIEQIEAHEEYQKLKKEAEEVRTKSTKYETELQEERKQREETSAKLAKYSLADNPEFVEKYERPYQTLEKRIIARVNGLNAGNPDHVTRVFNLLGDALTDSREDAFYNALGRLRDIDPDNYALYVGDVQNLRELGEAKRAAQENHQVTLQQLRQESAKSRERSVPDVYRTLEEINNQIRTSEAPLEEALNTDQYRNFLKSNGIDPVGIDNALKDAVRLSHLEGRPTKELIQLAAQGARKAKLDPYLAMNVKETQERNAELQSLRDEVAKLRGGQSFRPANGSANNNGATQHQYPTTREEFSKMTPQEIAASRGGWSKLVSQNA